MPRYVRFPALRPHLLAASLLLLAPLVAADSFQHYVTGNPADVEVKTRGLLVLQGGGTDVDENYVRMGEAGGGGDFVVLRASGADEYNDYIHALCSCDSVETLVFDDRAAAHDPLVIRTIRNAEALFIAGGDQSRYVRFWQDTPVQDAINFVAAKPAPVGGTSAGMAIMGEFVYSAMSEASLTPAVALADPYAGDVTLARNFLALPMMRNIITDQHLQERDRIGRTVVLLARLLQDGWTDDAQAIAADRETSLHVNPATGIATVFSTADHETPHVWFLRASQPADVCTAGEALEFGHVDVQRVAAGGTFDIGKWQSEGALHYTLGVDHGVLVSSQKSAYGD